MTLEKYREKRKFSQTLEPAGKLKVKGKDIFVVQKHDASHFHYDFRLEISGVLKSWAVPKGIPAKGEKHLAIETEDHPVEYADFSGIIPEGNYGAGKVEIFDKGIYKNLSDLSIEDAYKKGHLAVELKGKKLKGEFSLINTIFNRDKKNWLLIRK